MPAIRWREEAESLTSISSPLSLTHSASLCAHLGRPRIASQDLLPFRFGYRAVLQGADSHGQRARDWVLGQATGLRALGALSHQEDVFLVTFPCLSSLPWASSGGLQPVIGASGSSLSLNPSAHFVNPVPTVIALFK